MSKFSAQLCGSHVLVTGGTKGIGRAIVEKFLSEGANVSYCARTVRADDFAAFTNASDGAIATGTSVDINNPAAIKAWVQTAAEKFGRVDIVVANACQYAIEDTTEAWQISFQADIMGLLVLIDAATPYLQECEGTGSIVVISSIAGFESRQLHLAAPYGPFKRTQAMIAQDYARKLGRVGVRVNTVVPGEIATPSIKMPDGTTQPSTFEIGSKLYPEDFQKTLKDIPLGRFGCVDDVANGVVFLGSRLSSYITGSSLVIDGALSVRY